jgi:hypothetical protein
MAGKPRTDRSTIQAKHLGIRINEKEIGWLNAILKRAALYWQDLHARRPVLYPTVPKVTHAEVIRRLIAWEFKNNVLYKGKAHVEFIDDTIGKLDHLVNLANQRNAVAGISEKHTRGTMLMGLIEDEFARRELQRRPHSQYGLDRRDEPLVGAVELNDRFLVLRAKEKEAKVEVRRKREAATEETAAIMKELKESKRQVRS